VAPPQRRRTGGRAPLAHRQFGTCGLLELLGVTDVVGRFGVEDTCDGLELPPVPVSVLLPELWVWVWVWLWVWLWLGAVVGLTETNPEPLGVMVVGDTGVGRVVATTGGRAGAR
jgi:hypothetical protein